MSRTAYGKHATLVNTNTYPDDPNVPIGSDEWNESPSNSGMLGFTAETIASASSITPQNSVIIISGSTNVTTINQTNTNEYDLLYVFTSGTVTLVHNTGNINLLAGINKLLSQTSPTILIRKGATWVEYGGGITNALDDVGDVNITSNSTGEILLWNGSNWINNTLAEAGIAPIASPTFTGTVAIPNYANVETTLGGIATNASAIALKSPLASPTFTGTISGANLTLSGDLTVQGTTTTIDSTTINVQNAFVFEGATADAFETTLSIVDPTADRTISLPDATTTLVGIDVTQTLTNKTLINASLGASYLDITKMTAPSDPSSDIGRVYVKQIDGNNEGLFVKIKQSGSMVEVQLS